MFEYYFKLGMQSLRRRPMLTALMVLTLAIGVASCISTLTVLHVMGSDPIPSKSARLFVPLIDNAAADSFAPGEVSDNPQVSYRDAINLLQSKQGVRRSAIFGFGAPTESMDKSAPLLSAFGLAVTSDFFTMFEVPFKFGSGWSEDQEQKKTSVVVLSKNFSERLFGNENPVGRTVHVRGRDYQIIGVLDAWKPLPRYVHLINGNGGEFDGEDDIYMPFSTAIENESGFVGGMTCNNGGSGVGMSGMMNSECTWIQFWFELPKAEARGQLMDFLNSYQVEQQKLGRLPRHMPPRLFDVREWLEYRKVVSNDSKLSVWIAFGFLALCVVNAVGLLLAKFSVRFSEIGVRRALGASRTQIFLQFLVESSVIGLVGAVIGFVMSLGGLWMIAQQSAELAAVAHMDWQMFVVTFLLAVAASIVAGMLPAWRACQISPASQLKSQ